MTREAVGLEIIRWLFIVGLAGIVFGVWCVVIGGIIEWWRNR